MLFDLKVRRSTKTVEVLLLRFWEAPNVTKGGELQGMDMIILDEQVTPENI